MYIGKLNVFFLGTKKTCTFAFSLHDTKCHKAVDKALFGKIMDNPSRVSLSELEELRAERDRYPFSAPLRVLSLLAGKANRVDPMQLQPQSLVALYMLDGTRLQEQVDMATALAVPSAPEQPKDEAKPVRKEAAQAQGAFDILQEINSYQEVSFKTAPKSVILTNFLEKDAGITISDDGFELVPAVELAKKSVAKDETLCTESLAVVYERQGKWEKAIDMYQKLMAKYPEKSSTFARQIEFAQARLAEKLNK